MNSTVDIVHAQTEIPRLASSPHSNGYFPLPSAINHRRRRRPRLNLRLPRSLLPADHEPSPMASSLVFGISLLLAITSSEAREFLVGGADDAWQIPPNTTDFLNQWAGKNRFLVGDSLVWKYDPAKDSVLEVTREAYLSCNRSQPLAEHKDGATTVELRRSGAYYFISGTSGACEEGQRLIVVVMSERHSLRAQVAPAPAPAQHEGPAVAPTSGAAGKRRGAVVAATLVVFGVVML